MRIDVLNFGPYAGGNQMFMTPAEMAAIAARYSRSNDSMEEIYGSVSHIVSERHRVDAIFKYADYGHRSIMDMLTIPIRFEGISMYAAARLFQFSPMGAGQESSTRYISKGFDVIENQYGLTDEQYAFTKARVHEWLTGSAIAGERTKREEKNAILDSIRYTLPINARTNVFLVQSARAWADCCTHLLSSCHVYLEEEIGDIVSAIQSEIEKFCGPYPVKHIKHNTNIEFKYSGESLNRIFGNFEDAEKLIQKNGFAAHLRTQGEDMVDWWFEHCYESFSSFQRKNRYDNWPMEFYENTVSVGIYANFAEIRDLNRHRNRIFTDWYFYDKIPLREFPTLGTKTVLTYRCTLAQLLYEIELRTSQGAHPKYRAIMNDVLEKLLSKMRKGNAEFVRRNLFDNQETYREQE